MGGPPDRLPPDILVDIVRRRCQRLGVRSVSAPATEDHRLLPPSHGFLSALRCTGPAIIAEIKLGSPRIGSLAGRFDPGAQARLYRDGGAAAISVVVEPDAFGGSYELLRDCRSESGLPAVAKDFVVSSRQIDDARSAGAEAILLIASLYSAEQLAAWASYARSRDLVPLVETHGPNDRAKLAGRDWELVGVNNRDLRTFDVDLEHSIAALPELPVSAVKVSESGLDSGIQVARLAEAGFDAFLIGEALLLAENPAAKLAELVAGRPPSGL